jgi:hypothetical protein
LHKDPWKFRTFTDLPSVWEKQRPRNVVLGGLGRRGSPDSGEAGGGDRRGGGEAGSRSSQKSMVAGVGVGRRRRGVHSGARELRSPRAQCRRGDSTSRATSGGATFSMRLGAGSRGYKTVLGVGR